MTKIKVPAKLKGSKWLPKEIKRVFTKGTPEEIFGALFLTKAMGEKK